MRLLIYISALMCSVASAPVLAALQQPVITENTAFFSYADLADLALAAPIVAHVRIRDSRKIKPEIAPGLKPGWVRFLVVADVIALVRGDQGLPPRITYLVDLPTDSRGKTAKLAKSESIIFGEPGRIGEIRLIAGDAQIAWSPTGAATVRAILGEAAKADAPPRITGIGSGFTSPGSLPGERETQIFLDSVGDKPVSLSILRQPGAAVRWFVSLGEVVDDALVQPPRDTLLWYRLACFLPSAFPSAKLADLPAEDGAAIRADYQFVMAGLGRCPRTRKTA